MHLFIGGILVTGISKSQKSYKMIEKFRNNSGLIEFQFTDVLGKHCTTLGNASCIVTHHLLNQIMRNKDLMC